MSPPQAEAEVRVGCLSAYGKAFPTHSISIYLCRDERGQVATFEVRLKRATGRVISSFNVDTLPINAIYLVSMGDRSPLSEPAATARRRGG